MRKVVDWLQEAGRGKFIAHNIALGVTLVLTYQVITWSMDFADGSARDGVDIAAILTSINVPLATLQGYVIKVYAIARQAE